MEPTISTSPLQPIFPAGKTYQELEEEAKVITNTIGDDPVKSEEVLQKQAAADKLKAEAAQAKAIQEAIDRNMGKYQGAMEDTMYEIMNGKPRVKKNHKESDK